MNNILPIRVKRGNGQVRADTRSCLYGPINDSFSQRPVHNDCPDAKTTTMRFPFSLCGLMEMPHLWESANNADFHSCLEKSRQKTARLSHIPTGPTGHTSLIWKDSMQNSDIMLQKSASIGQ